MKADHVRWIAAFLLLIVASRISPAQMAQEYADLARRVEAIEPTPAGEGHLGRLESGATVQLRFPIPKPLPLACMLNVGNIVAFRGKGTSYKLVLRRNAKDGEVIYEGPVIANGDEWNGENRKPIDITAKLKPEDAERGYIDVFASGIVEGDGWTLYRNNPKRPVTALLVEATPELRQAIEQERVMAERGIALIPTPQRIALPPGELELTKASRICLGQPPEHSEAGRFAAQDLAEQIFETCGLKLPIVFAGEPTKDAPGDNDIFLCGDKGSAPTENSYRVLINKRGVFGMSNDEAGIFYAAQTIAQLVTEQGALPFTTIEDWPAFPVRGLQYDVARGQTVNVEWWKRVIRSLARMKLNAIMIYGEDDYNFRTFPFLGRPGTFTPEKAAELSAYARQYHLQLIPQFESLGHASAVLAHKELADLREAGGSWVFCTSNPKTWEFLDAVYKGLCEQFPDTKYIHVGGDEFEGGFGKCPACRAKVEKQGYTGLYAEHMNHLNQLVKKQGRTMLFWQSHGGPTPELSYLTIKAAEAGLMERDCIPTEWIYHGPQSYPEIEQYQKLGFKDVWASPAIVCYSTIWPDYVTSYRGIRGFLRAGAERRIQGAMTTTWEWMHGAVVSNSLLGMGYVAECSWSLGKTPVKGFERRFGQRWLGLRGEDVAEHVHSVLAEPWPAKGPAAVMRSGKIMTDLFWEDPRTTRARLAMRNDVLRANADQIVQAADDALARLDAIRKDARRNADLLPYTELAFKMYRFDGEKLLALDKAAQLYAQAVKAGVANASAPITEAAKEIEGLSPSLERCIKLYQPAVAVLGAYEGDVKRMEKQREAIAKLAGELRDLASACEASKVKELPPAAKFGLLLGRAVLLGRWEPKQMSETGSEIRLDVTGKIRREGPMDIEWTYMRGERGIKIFRTALLADGQEVAAEEHEGWAGGGSHGNTYHLNLPTFSPKVKYELVGKISCPGGTESFGEIWLFTPEE